MQRTLVLGTGMVGVDTALALQERGHLVILLDRRGPGDETSYGNAGIIQTEAAEPYAMPRSLGSLWRILAGRTNDVVWHLNAMPEYMRPLAEYHFHSAGPRHRSPRVLEQGLRDIERTRREYGVPFEALDSQALARAEPAMRQPLAGAIRWTSPLPARYAAV